MANFGCWARLGTNPSTWEQAGTIGESRYNCGVYMCAPSHQLECCYYPLSDTVHGHTEPSSKGEQIVTLN